MITMAPSTDKGNGEGNGNRATAAAGAAPVPPPPAAAATTRRDVERMIREARARSEEIESETGRQRDEAERSIVALQREMDEIRFFDEIDGIDDDVDVAGEGDDDDCVAVVAMDSSPTSIMVNNQFVRCDPYSLEKMNETADANKALKNKLKLSDKRTKILEQQVQILQLNQRELTAENASLHKFVDLSRAAASARDDEAARRAGVEAELDRTRLDLRRSESIVDESVRRVEASEARLAQAEKSHGEATRAMRASLEVATADLLAAASAEELHLETIEGLRRTLQEAEERHEAERGVHRTTIAGYEGDLAAVRRDLESERSALEESEAAVADLRASSEREAAEHSAALAETRGLLDEANMKLDEASSLDEGRRAVIEEMTASLSLAEQGLVDAESSHEATVAGLTDELKAAHSEIETLRESASTTVALLEEKETVVNNLERDAAELKSLLDDANSSLEERDGSIAELREALRTSDVECSVIREKLDDFRAHSGETMTNIQSVHKGEMAELLGVVASTERQVLELEERNVALTSSAESAREELEAEASRSAEKASQIVALQSNLDELSLELSELRKTLSDSEGVHNETADELRSLRQEHVALKDASDGKDADIASAGDRVAGMEASLKQLADEVVAKDDGIFELKATLHDKEQQLEYLQSILDGHREAITEREQSVRDLHDELDIAAESKTELQKRLVTTEASLSSNKETNAHLQEELDQLRAQLGVQITSLSKSLDQATLNLTERDAELQKMRENLARQQEEEAKLKRSLQDSLDHTSVLERQMSKIEEQTAVELKTKDDSIASLRKDLRESEQSLLDAQKAIDEKEQQLANVERDFKHFDSITTSAADDLAKAKSLLSSSEVTKMQMQREIQRLKTKLASAEHTASTLKEMELKSHEESLSMLTQVGDDCDEKVAAAENKASALEMEKRTLEKRIRSLEAERIKKSPQLSSKVPNRSQRNLEVSAETERLASKVKVLEKSIMTLEAENDILEAEKGSLEASLEMCNASLRDVERESRRKLEEVEAKFEDIEQQFYLASKKANASMQATKDRMIEDAVAADSQLREVKEELRKLKEDRGLLSIEMEELQSEKLSLEQALEANRQSLLKSETECETRIKEIQEMYYECRSQLDAAHATQASLEEYVDRLLQGTKEKEKETARLTAQAKNSVHESKIAPSLNACSPNRRAVEQTEEDIDVPFQPMSGSVDANNKSHTELETEDSHVESLRQLMSPVQRKPLPERQNLTTTSCNKENDLTANNLSQARRNWEALKKEKTVGQNDTSPLRYRSRRQRQKYRTGLRQNTGDSDI